MYSSRLAGLEASQSAAERRHRQLGYIKLAVLGVTVVAFVLGMKSRSVSAFWVVVPIVALAMLEKAHERLLVSSKRCARAIAFYKRGLARLEDRWIGAGDDGADFLDSAHPYARDLDLFGKGSLFELLCTARTTPGRNTLAQWLMVHAPVQEIQRRQDAVRDLAPRLDFREEIAVSGEDIRSRQRTEALLAWAEGPAVLNPKPARVAALALAGAWLASLLVWALWGFWEVTVVASVVNRIYYAKFRLRVQKIIEAEKFVREFALLPSVLKCLEGEKFESEKLIALQTQLKQDGISPEKCIGQLRKWVQALESRRSLLIHVTDPFILWSPQTAFAIEAWRQKFAPAFHIWLATVGEMEALSALANYCHERPEDDFPEFATDAVFEATGLAHPLLPRARAVGNDIRFEPSLRAMVISGPNMSGKSTFVRAVGLNATLAQCGAPICARKLRMSPLQVTASICILDSLQGGVSRFYAEISRLKLIAELAEKPPRVLFLLDELLSGTNSDDRRVGAEAFVASMVAKGAIGLVTTHDLALTQMANNPANQAANFHFEDHLENGQLRFDYKLVSGVARSSNALKLMRSIGLEV